VSYFKGTPGPWVANGEDRAVVETLLFCGDVSPLISGDGGYRGDIASIQSCNHIGPHGISRAEAAANARLIAAAPDLLEALQEAAHALNIARLVMADKEARDIAGEFVAKAEAAIAKATQP